MTNKEKRKVYDAMRYIRDKEKITARRERFLAENPGYAHEYYLKNREKILKQTSKYAKDHTPLLRLL